MSTSTLDRRRLLLGVLIAAALVSLAIALVIVLRPAPAAPTVAAHARPTLLPPGPGTKPVKVIGADGSEVSCPTGSEPSIYLTYGSFTPRLTNATVMKKGTYHIHMRGTVNNETGSAIRIRSISASVRLKYWSAARITVPRAIKAQSSVPIVIDGDYRSTTSGPVDVATRFDWRWQSAELTSCGEAGLVADD
jgi:hypothetical protein